MLYKVNHLNYHNQKGEVYCRRLHQVRVMDAERKFWQECMQCSMLAGSCQGEGVECYWEDVIDTDFIRIDFPKQELRRVSQFLANQECLKKVKSLPYEQNIWHYQQSADKQNRYILGKKGQRPLICFGVNPSTASPEDLDPTIKSLASFAQKLDFDSYIMLNLYPLRATNPNNLPDQLCEESLSHNLDIISETLSQYSNCYIWAAWGTSIEKRKYLYHSLRQIVDIAAWHRANWLSIGQLSKAGHPHHPLYLAKSSQVRPFDIDNYL